MSRRAPLVTKKVVKGPIDNGTNVEKAKDKGKGVETSGTKAIGDLAAKEGVEAKGAKTLVVEEDVATVESEEIVVEEDIGGTMLENDDVLRQSDKDDSEDESSNTEDQENVEEVISSDGYSSGFDSDGSFEDRFSKNTILKALAVLVRARKELSGKKEVKIRFESNSEEQGAAPNSYIVRANEGDMADALQKLNKAIEEYNAGGAPLAVREVVELGVPFRYTRHRRRKTDCT